MALTLINLLKQVKNILASTNGGTGNGFTKFSGPASSEKTFTLPNSSANVLTDNAAVTVAQGGTGLATLTAHDVVVGAGASNVVLISPSTAGFVLTSNGTSADPTFQAAASPINFADDETPTGAVDGANDTFTLAHSPSGSSLQLHKNGQSMIGGGADYTLAAGTITYVTGAIPQVGDVHRAFYRY